MAGIEDLIRQRIQEQLDARDKQRRGVYDELGAIKGILGGGSQQQPQSASVYGNMQGGMASPPPAVPGGQGQEISPEDYDYYVDIERRNVADPNNPEETIGWDKKVKRYAQRRTVQEVKEPTIGDLTTDGMKSRDSKGRFTKRMNEDQPDLFSGDY